MKIINEKGKLFGIINIIDLCVLLVILIAVGAFGYKTFAPKLSSAPTKTKEMWVTVKFTITNEEALNALKKGDHLFSVLNPEKDATIESVSTKPAEVRVQTDDGDLFYVQDKKMKEVKVVFKMITPDNGGNAVTKLGSQEIAVGKSFLIKTRFAEFSGGKILNVETK